MVTFHHCTLVWTCELNHNFTKTDLINWWWCKLRYSWPFECCEIIVFVVFADSEYLFYGMVLASDQNVCFHYKWPHAVQCKISCLWYKRKHLVRSFSSPIRAAYLRWCQGTGRGQKCKVSEIFNPQRAVLLPVSVIQCGFTFWWN